MALQLRQVDECELELVRFRRRGLRNSVVVDEAQLELVEGRGGTDRAVLLGLKLGFGSKVALVPAT